MHSHAIDHGLESATELKFSPLDGRHWTVEGRIDSQPGFIATVENALTSSFQL